MNILYNKDWKPSSDFRPICVKSCNLLDHIELASVEDFYTLLNLTGGEHYFYHQQFSGSSDFKIHLPLQAGGRNSTYAVESSVAAFNKTIEALDYTKPVMIRLFFFHEGRTYTYTEYLSEELEAVLTEPDVCRMLSKLHLLK